MVRKINSCDDDDSGNGDDITDDDVNNNDDDDVIIIMMIMMMIISRRRCSISSNQGRGHGGMASKCPPHFAKRVLRISLKSKR